MFPLAEVKKCNQLLSTSICLFCVRQYSKEKYNAIAESKGRERRSSLNDGEVQE